MEHTSHKSENCLNCGYKFQDENNFCPRCGQANHSLRVPFRHLIFEYIEGILHIDSKLFTTFFSLVLRPGLLTQEFNSGKRMRFIPPVRIYIFISFIFFLLLNMTAGHNSGTHNKEKKSHAAISLGNNFTSDELRGLNQKQVDSLYRAHNVEMTKFNQYIMKQALKIENGPEGAFAHMLLKGFSYMMFFLMPLFGLLVMIFNRKRKGFYFEYLIYSIHFHCFVFLLYSIYMVIALWFSSSVIAVLINIVIPLYFFLSMKAVFPQGNTAAALKAISISIIYFFTLVFFLVITVLISVFIF